MMPFLAALADTSVCAAPPDVTVLEQSEITVSMFSAEIAGTENMMTAPNVAMRVHLNI